MIRYLADTNADTNILGYFTHHADPSLHQRMFVAMQTDEVAISVITRAEMRFGQALLNANDKRQASIDLLLDEIATLAWTAAAADRYGVIAAQLRKTGQPIGEMDAMIAAHALTENLYPCYPQHLPLWSRAGAAARRLDGLNVTAPVYRNTAKQE